MGGKSTRRTREEALWRVFSQWIRLRDADEAGMVSCVTCGARMHWKDAQAGHFWKRQHQATKFHEQNVHVQCVRCNKWLNGNEGEHAAYILRVYGQHAFNNLEALHRQTYKLPLPLLEAKIEEYKERLAKLDNV